MTSFARTASYVAGAALAAVIGLAGTAGTAGADKPRGGCPPAFTFVSEDAMRALFGGSPGFDELFTAIDKNADGLLCAQETPGVYNTVDNVASVGAR